MSCFRLVKGQKSSSCFRPRSSAPAIDHTVWRKTVQRRCNGATNAKKDNYYPTKVTDGDSLGWDLPEDLVSRIKMHVDRINGPDSYNKEVEMCYDLASHHNGRQSFRQGCSKIYPIQICGNICGPVTIIVASIACHKMEFFRQICSKTRLTGTPNIYILEPSKYAKYLQSVLLTWIAEKETVEMVVPQNNDESDSHSEEDIIQSSASTDKEPKRKSESKVGGSKLKGEKKKSIDIKRIMENFGAVTPKWLMSDLAPQFYDAFSEVNNCCPKGLFCSWHVDKTWKSEIRQKTSCQQLQTEVYKMLPVVLEQTDVSSFQDYLHALME
eukprot:gene5630-10846_t